MVSMRTLLIAAAVVAGVCPARADSFRELAAAQKCESRLRAIYERGEFRARAVQAEWLPDSSGYVLFESDPGSGAELRVTYDVRSGERRSSERRDVNSERKSRMRSPDGSRLLEVTRDGIEVVDAASGQKTLLIRAEPGRDLQYRGVSWSPDGRRVLLIESDASRVRERATLVPDDPSYPSVARTRFARVGEQLESLRVGFVNADGTGLAWVPLKTPSDGCYLGQVEWAGNPDEILIEWFSRFRDRREFLLANVSGAITTLFEETSETWVESSQGRNSGLVWINSGRDFIFLSERDGWRHAYLGSAMANRPG